VRHIRTHLGVILAAATSCASPGAPPAHSPERAANSTQQSAEPTNVNPDDTSARYWAEKFRNPTTRQEAIIRLEDFVRRTYFATRPADPQRLALADEIVEPLTSTYVRDYATLDARTRVWIIEQLALLADPRSEPAVKKALVEFAHRPTPEKDELDVKWAALAAVELRLQSLAEPMLQAFVRFRASTLAGGRIYRDFSESMVALSDPSWVSRMESMLEPEMTIPRSRQQEDLLDAYRDQLFWQVTAAEVLGHIARPESVRPLFRVMLDPQKADVHATAVLALVKIGKPTIDVAVEVLRGQAQDLVNFHARAVRKSGPTAPRHVEIAALVLGVTGRHEATAALVAALKDRLNPEQRLAIARTLTQVPSTRESLQAFRDVFEHTPPDRLLAEQAALPVLAERAGEFFDPKLVD
jgi:hypothetical protein